MDSIGLVASSSMTSSRWPSARLASLRYSMRDQRETSRPLGAPNVVVSASSHSQFASSPIPAAFKGPAARQTMVATAKSSHEAASWSMQSNIPSLVHTSRNGDISLEFFTHNPIAWFMNLVYRLQSVLTRLFTGSRASSAAQQPQSSTTRSGLSSGDALASFSQQRSSDFAVSACEQSASRRYSSWRYVPPGVGQFSNDAEQMPLRLVAAEMPPAFAGQRPGVPAASLSIATAAVFAFGGYWFFYRWKEMVEIRKEQAQWIAVKRDILARQKQRFQRALVVDSVNLELPSIKDIDVQPGPVRVEKILSQGSSQRRDAPVSSLPGGSSVPGLGGESLRQWQKFMAASRAKEVTDVSGSPRGGRGAAEQSTDRPYVALDDRMLADLSERIRRANDLTAVGETPPPMPVITFDQLYANNQESDDEAMARRAAERKARWQKQHPTASAPSGASQNHLAAATMHIPAQKPAATTPSSSKALKPENPFAIGILNDTSPSGRTTSIGGNTAAMGRNSSARSGIKPHDVSSSRACLHFDMPALASNVTGGRVPGHNPFLNVPAAKATTFGHADISTRGRDASDFPVHTASAWISGEQEIKTEEPATSTATESPTACSTAVVYLDNLAAEGSSQQHGLNSTPTEFGLQTSTSSASQEVPDGHIGQHCGPSHGASSGDGTEGDGKSPQQELVDLSNPSRNKRQPAYGQLRKPETHAPALIRLMRRPGGASATSERRTTMVDKKNVDVLAEPS